MKFIHISDTAPVIEYLTNTISAHLAEEKRVLWLVPGGSSIAIAAAVSKKLQGKDLRNLAVTLTDERFGPVDHPDSNWFQLHQAGFNLPGATMAGLLFGGDRSSTTSRYANLLQKALEFADYRLGFFGMGADGHTAGILPATPAVNAKKLTASYDAGTFERMTMTPVAIRKLDEVVLYATGQEKWPMLTKLKENRPLNEQPAQVLKTVKTFTIFTDYADDQK